MNAKKLLQMAPVPAFVKGKVPRGGAARAVLAAAVLLLLSASGASPAAAEAFDTSAFAHVLEAYVTGEGQVQYAALKKNPAELDTFLRQLAAVSPENRPDLFPTPTAQMAYWINAYNAFVIHAVVEAYPISSVRDLKFGFGLLFFKRAKFVAGGKKYSLDDIEHGILRRRFSDPRVHFAVNCASTSCPRIWPVPFDPDQLDQQLHQAARAFVAREQNVWMRGDVLFLSKIFAWYEKDFLQALEREGVKTPTVVNYVVRYLPAEVARQVQRQKPRVEFYDYDWSLNDAAVPAD